MKPEELDDKAIDYIMENSTVDRMSDWERGSALDKAPE